MKAWFNMKESKICDIERNNDKNISNDEECFTNALDDSENKKQNNEIDLSSKETGKIFPTDRVTRSMSVRIR